MTNPTMALLDDLGKFGLELDDDALYPTPSARGARRDPGRHRGRSHLEDRCGAL